MPGGHNKLHAPVEHCVAIDASMLHSASMFGGGKSRANFWTFTSCVVFAFTAARAAELWLVVWPGASWRAVVKLIEGGGVSVGMFDHKQRIQTSTTVCNFGKVRYWLHCPKCNKRVFKLFCHPRLFINGVQSHEFYCRHCLGLTYVQRQSRGYWLQQVRVGKIKRKLIRRGAEDSDGIAWHAFLPDRPRGMKQRRYQWIAERFESAADELRGAFVGDMKRMIKKFDGK